MLGILSVVTQIPNRWNLPHLGYGMGLRGPHYNDVLGKWPAVDFFEVISENFMQSHGHQMYVLDQVAERYKVLLHGVSMSIGSTDPLDMDYLARLKSLAKRVKATFISDHLCWTSLGGHNTHDLLPVPLTEEALQHVAERVRFVQDYFGLPMALENPSNYLEFTPSMMPEAEFLARLCEKADCGLLLDVNNIYVTSYNHGIDPYKYIETIPVDRIIYHHLAGHTKLEKYLLDTHSDYVLDKVWDLYAFTHQRTGGRSTMIEWDEKIPSFTVVCDEVAKARAVADDPSYRPPAPVIQTQAHDHVAQAVR